MSHREQVRRWIDGELSPAQAQALQARAEREPALARALEDAKRVDAALAALKRVRPGMPDALIERSVRHAVRRRLEEENRRRSAWDWLFEPRTLRLRVRPLAAGLFACAATVALWVLPQVDRTGQGAASGPAIAGDPGAHSDRPGAEVTGEAPEAPAGWGEMLRESLEVPIRFMMQAEGARSVAVAGDFNAWKTDEALLEDQDGDGIFVGTVELPPGTYAYAFVVDGERWVADPHASNYRDDGFGNRNAVLRID